MVVLMVPFSQLPGVPDEASADHDRAAAVFVHSVRFFLYAVVNLPEIFSPKGVKYSLLAHSKLVIHKDNGGFWNSILTFQEAQCRDDIFHCAYLQISMQTYLAFLLDTFSVYI